MDREEKARFVNRMFASIAGRYDLLNTLLSFNRDKGWRRFAVSKAGLKAGSWALDVATGTGELALELAREVGPRGRVVGVDFCEEMLRVAREKVEGGGHEGQIEFKAGRAEALPFPAEVFDGATIGFALRNVADIGASLREMGRVVKKGGRVVVLEFTQPENPLFRRAYYLYFFRILPLIGGLISGRKDAYTYLPHSVLAFPTRAGLKGMMEEVGLRDVTIYPLTGGIVAVHVGTKA